MLKNKANIFKMQGMVCNFLSSAKELDLVLWALLVNTSLSAMAKCLLAAPWLLESQANKTPYFVPANERLITRSQTTLRTLPSRRFKNIAIDSFLSDSCFAFLIDKKVEAFCVRGGLLYFQDKGVIEQWPWAWILLFFITHTPAQCLWLWGIMGALLWSTSNTFTEMGSENRGLDPTSCNCFSTFCTFRPWERLWWIFRDLRGFKKTKQNRVVGDTIVSKEIRQGPCTACTVLCSLIPI